MKTIFLKINNSQIFYNDVEFIPIENTNLPYWDMSFRSEYEDIFWEVEIKKIDKDKEVLSINVIDYYPKVSGLFRSQNSKKPFKSIHFDLLDWIKVEPQLTSYRISTIKDHFFGLTTGQQIESRKSDWPDPNSISSEPIELESEIEEIPIEKHRPIDLKRNIEEVHRISILDFIFHDGFASTSKKLKQLEFTSEIVINNLIFKKEFEYIKDYFVRHFGRKTVKVFIEYVIESDQIIDLKCKCPDLEEIDEAVIEAIKVKRTNILRKPSQMETKSILDLEEIFQIMNDPSVGKNVFEQSEEDIVNHFINIEGIRNKQQLSFLANNLQLRSEKIRFTIHPIFGFVFFYEAANNSYFIWELLDSHATYIWNVDNSVMSTMSLFMELEKAIEYIKALGREKYKQAYKEGLINATIQFKSLYHKRNEASGFKDWQEKLKSVINQ